jgi:HEAT repeat protein
MIALLLSLALQDDPSAAPLEEFKTAYKNREVSARVAAVNALAATQHDKVYTQLGKLLLTDEKDVRIAAAKGLGACTAEKKAKPANYLLAGAAANAKDTPVLVAILDALGKLKQDATLPEVEKHLKSKDIAVGTAAVKAVETIKSSRSVSALVAMLKWLYDNAQDAPAYNGGGGTPGLGGGGGTMADQDAKQRHGALTPLANKALQTITGQSISGHKEWENWLKSGGRAK